METKVIWKDPDNLPAHDGKSWAVINKHIIANLDIEEIRTATRRWLPVNSLLVGAPGASKFLPPISIQQLESEVLRNVGRNSKRLVLAFIGTGFLVALAGLAEQTRDVLPLSLIFILFGGLFFFDYKFGLKSINDIYERALFLRWIKTSRQARTGVRVWLLIGAIIGTAQLWLQRELGGIDALFVRFGAMYASIDVGEYWRLLSGPYFHYSITHYSINVLLLLFIGTLTWAMNGPICIPVFVLGNIVGVWLQMSFGGDAFNNFGGISSGVYSLFGLFLLSGVSGAIKLPRGFAILCGGLALFGIIGSWIVSKNAATVAHLSGFMSGVLFFLLAHWISSFFRRRPERRSLKDR